MSLILSSLSKLVSTKKKEHYDNDNENENASISLIDILVFLISCYAAYLSWSCNTVKNVQFFPKLVYAFFAFLFGVLYVVFYGVFKEKLTPCKA